MIHILEIVYLIGFLSSWFVFYMFSFAYWQRKWPSLAKENYGEDMIFSLFWALCFAPAWPIGWIIIYILIIQQGYGLKLK